MCCTLSRKLHGLYGRLNGIFVARGLRKVVALSGHSAITAEQFVMCNTTRGKDEPMSRRCKCFELDFEPIPASICNRKCWLHTEGYGGKIGNEGSNNEIAAQTVGSRMIQQNSLLVRCGSTLDSQHRHAISVIILGCSTPLACNPRCWYISSLIP